jgi:hypothetical protein
MTKLIMIFLLTSSVIVVLKMMKTNLSNSMKKYLNFDFLSLMETIILNSVLFSYVILYEFIDNSFN